MKKWEIGVMSDNFRLGPREGIRKAAELGVDGVQIYTVGGEMDPENLDKKKRADLKAFCADLGIEIASLCAELGGGFRSAPDNPKKVERTKRILELAGDLGTNVVTSHIGVTPEDPNDQIYQTMVSACREMAEHAAGLGVVYAVETGPEKSAVLKRLLDDVASKGIGVNLDPANLVMVVAEDPAQAARTLGEYIVHTHAKDGVQLRPCDAAQEYHGGAPADAGPGFEERPLGEGDVNWDTYLSALEEVGYDGYLTIEREAGGERAEDIRKAIDFLRAKMA